MLSIKPGAKLYRARIAPGAAPRVAFDVREVEVVGSSRLKLSTGNHVFRDQPIHLTQREAVKSELAEIAQSLARLDLQMAEQRRRRAVFEEWLRTHPED